MTYKPLSANPLELAVPRKARVGQFASAVPLIYRAGFLTVRKPSHLVNLANNLRRWGCSITFLLENAALYCPERIALIDDAGQLSYRELREQTIGMAGALQQRGVGAEDKVAIIARNSRVNPLVLGACNYLGAVPLIVNPYSSAKQITATLERYDVRVLIADVEYSEGIELGNIPVILGYGSEDYPADAPVTGYQQAIAAAPKPILPKRPFRGPTVIMSSGTSGLPKAVVRDIPRSPQVLSTILPAIPWRAMGVIQMSGSLFHSWGWMNLNIVYGTKSTMILRRVFDPVQAADDCVEYGVTGIISSGIFLKPFDEELTKRDGNGRAGIHKVEFIANAGNAIPPYLVESLNARFGTVVCSMYGSTEHGPIAIAPPENLATDPKRAGYIPEGVEIKILDEDTYEEMPVGEKGRIFSANSETMQGYLDAGDTVDMHEGLLGTGDVGRMDEEGNLYVYGRVDNMILKGGENVYPQELENFLEKQPQVKEVYVRGIRRELMSSLEAYIVRKPGVEFSTEDVRALVKNNLAQINMPDAVHWMSELPRNAVGKVVPRLLPTAEGDSEH